MTEAKLLLCDCLKSQSINAEEIEKHTGLACSKVHTALCHTEAAVAETALQDGNVVIACAQERTFFEDLAGDLGVDEPHFIDIRDRAGWTSGDAAPTAKMAALIAEAMLPDPGERVVDVSSEGTCLLLGEPDIAFDAAKLLSGTLSVTVLVAPDAEIPVTDDRRFDVVRGKIKSATGALGGFQVAFDTLQERIPGGRGTFNWTEPKGGGHSACDIIVDLRRDAPLFPAADKREGYLRADPGNKDAYSKVILEASQLIGTFEKPIYVKVNEDLCAHSRAQKTGCNRCLNLCPTGAITPAGDHITIDPMVCAGCGMCSAVCPSGAVSYDAPTPQHVFKRIEMLSTTWRKASSEPSTAAGP